MTRIVSGFAGSIALAVPRSGTRPTSDRVREAMFSALEARDALHGARVLDLYAGSGALGLEAASRGAASVTLVEHNAGAARVCRANVAAIERAAGGNALADASPRLRVVVSSVRSYLTRSDAPPLNDTAPLNDAAPFDLVFSDPPYDLSERELTEDLTALVPLLAPEALVIVERSTRSPEPLWPAKLARERRKDYGETVVWTASPTDD